MKKSYQKNIFYASIRLMRLMGIDFGTKRIGIAISDEGGTLSFPKDIVLNDANTFQRIGEILKTERVEEIVVGESVDFSGRLNVLSARIDIFVAELTEKFGLPIHKQKEFLTSVEARKQQDGKISKSGLSPSQAHSKLKDKKRGRVDAGAAALILQRYLDKINKAAL